MKKTVSLFLSILILCSLLVTAHADEGNLFNPHKTNEVYEGLIQGFEGTNYKDFINESEYHNSYIWAYDGWTRALLVVSLGSDLKQNNKEIYQKYYPNATECYVAATKNLFGEGCIYSVLLIDGSDALMFTYTPGSSSTSYSEMQNMTQKNIDNLYSISIETWEVTKEDADTLVERIQEIDDGKSSFGKVIDEVEFKIQADDTSENEIIQPATTPKPTPRPTPTPRKTHTKSELKEITEWSLVVRLSMDYPNYDINNTGYRIDSYTQTSTGWTVEGIVVLYDYSGNGRMGTFKVRIDDGESSGHCTIKLN